MESDHDLNAPVVGSAKSLIKSIKEGKFVKKGCPKGVKTTQATRGVAVAEIHHEDPGLSPGQNPHDNRAMDEVEEGPPDGIFLEVDPHPSDDNYSEVEEPAPESGQGEDSETDDDMGSNSSSSEHEVSFHDRSDPDNSGHLPGYSTDEVSENEGVDERDLPLDMDDPRVKDPIARVRKDEREKSKAKSRREVKKWMQSHRSPHLTKK